MGPATASNGRALVDFIRSAEIDIDYAADVETARAAALPHVHRAGAPRGAHDLIIAATAVETNRVLLTIDRSARFRDLPGVQVIEV